MSSLKCLGKWILSVCDSTELVPVRWSCVCVCVCMHARVRRDLWQSPPQICHCELRGSVLLHPFSLPSPCLAACLSSGSPTLPTPLLLLRGSRQATSENPGAPGPVHVQAAVSSASVSVLQQLTCTRVISEQGIIYPADVNENILSTVLFCSLK